MTDQLSSLIQAVDAADSSDLLLEAVEDLADACLEGAIPTLIAVLSYNNPGAAVAAVDGLIQLGETHCDRFNGADRSAQLYRQSLGYPSASRNWRP